MTSSDYDLLLSRLGTAFLRDFFKALADGPFPPEVEVLVHFLTTAPGIELSPAVRAAYPAQITVVLRARSLGSPLQVEDQACAVRLSLLGEDTRVRIPFAAILGIVDERSGMALQFPIIRTPGSDALGEAIEEPAAAAEESAPEAGKTSGAGASNVVPLHRPRRT